MITIGMRIIPPIMITLWSIFHEALFLYQLRERSTHVISLLGSLIIGQFSFPTIIFIVSLNQRSPYLNRLVEHIVPNLGISYSLNIGQPVEADIRQYRQRCA
jgi:hypothetical protein